KTFPGKGIQFVPAVKTKHRVGSGRTWNVMPFLHRERLDGETRNALSSVLGGKSHILLVHGEPGVGKTRSLQHISEVAAAQGFRVGQGHGVRGEEAPAYWPWVEMLRQALPEELQEAQSLLIDDGVIRLASMVPALRSPLRASAKSPDYPRPTRFLLFDGVIQFIRSISIASPICLLFDDLQLSDAGSLSLFAHVARELRDARVFLVGTYRDIEVGAANDVA